MTSRTVLTKDGPLVLLAKIASGFSEESGADIRAQLTIHTRSGKSWTGIPSQVVSDKTREYVILEIQPKKILSCSTRWISCH